MFFNCTFAHNATLESLCCVDHPYMDGPPLQVSPDNTTASCVSGNGTTLNKCLVSAGVLPEFCQLQEVNAASTTITSSARPSRRVGMLLLVFVGLSLLAGTSATTCRIFSRELSASRASRADFSEPQRVSEVVSCKESKDPCPVSIRKRPEWRMRWDFAADVALSHDAMDEVYDSIDEASTADAARLPDIPDEMFVPPGEEGYIQAAVGQLSVPGSLEECDDGDPYNGVAVFLNPSRFRLAVRTDVTDADRKPLSGSA